MTLDHPKEALPGRDVEFEIALSAPDGSPLAGEVTLWLVDRAVLALGQEQRLDPVPDFVPGEPSHVMVRDTRGQILGYLPYVELPGGGEGAAEEGLLERVTVRKNFQPVPFYDPRIRVGSDGKTTVRVTLPDNLTDFAIRAKAVSGVERFGHAKSRIAVRLPVIVQPALPRFVRPGDSFIATAIGRLVSGDAGPGRAEARFAGVELQGDAKLDLSWLPDTPRRLEFPVVVPTPVLDEAGRATSTEATFTVGVERLTDGASDAFEVKLPIHDDRRRRLEREITELGPGAPYEWAEIPEPARPGSVRRALFASDRPALVRMVAGLDALMTYPYGCTEHGRPYFVMELVKGVPISDFCDDNRLTTRERLELFVQVCQAVHHAHQKGIIHRDLKPTNVLVALYDDRPVPKVIDFGVAKATNQQLTEKTLFTEIGSILGTWEYMSPEQAVLNQLDVDTRSDVYSLGVLLYELLTGETPLDRQRLREAQIMETLRMIREDEPPKPSTRVSSQGEQASTMAAYRKAKPESLASEIRGDLDWIVMKALAKERSRRYDSANRFAEDVQRHLNSEPVHARPPTVWYQVQKFYRRHSALTWSAAALALALFVGLTGTLLGFRKYYVATQELGQTLARLQDKLMEEAINEAAKGKESDALAVLSQVGLDGTTREVWKSIVRAQCALTQGDNMKAVKLLKKAKGYGVERRMVEPMLAMALFESGESFPELDPKLLEVSERPIENLLTARYFVQYDLDFVEGEKRINAYFEKSDSSLGRLTRSRVRSYLAANRRSKEMAEAAVLDAQVAVDSMPDSVAALTAEVSARMEAIEVMRLSGDRLTSHEHYMKGVAAARKAEARAKETVDLFRCAMFYGVVGDLESQKGCWRRAVQMDVQGYQTMYLLFDILQHDLDAQDGAAFDRNCWKSKLWPENRLPKTPDLVQIVAALLDAEDPKAREHNIQELRQAFSRIKATNRGNLRKALILGMLSVLGADYDEVEDLAHGATGGRTPEVSEDLDLHFLFCHYFRDDFDPEEWRSRALARGHWWESAHWTFDGLRLMGRGKREDAIKSFANATAYRESWICPLAAALSARLENNENWPQSPAPGPAP